MSRSRWVDDLSGTGRRRHGDRRSTAAGRPGLRSTGRELGHRERRTHSRRHAPTALRTEPNPALHLTPPADLERIAHPMMAVQVSFIVRQPRGSRCTRRCWKRSPTCRTGDGIAGRRPCVRPGRQSRPRSAGWTAGPTPS
ncbi:hypothetical protein C1280_11885 [Gemmata obscuriglobus]|uniref:Uncharacterized protein n=1 Tax=Gemmata obscuriglobus TaxID=114 RepID=A0A2Z3H233_9BACT|nr:hypothetical protein C1280_11885 [Gemmata obscuriglobus]